MNKEFKIKWLSKSDIDSIAKSFIKKYHRTKSIPVDIERIIEFNLEMDIIPIPGLKDSFELAGFDIDAFISSDLQSITVDQYVMEKREARYRFTLAHEIAHKLLHGDFYEQFNFYSIDDWIATIIEIQSNVSLSSEREKAEWQADELAGRILVPTVILAEEFTKEQDITFRTFSKDHPDYTSYSDNIDYLDFIKDVTIHSLAKRFMVSDDVIRIRLENDKLIER